MTTPLVDLFGQAAPSSTSATGRTGIPEWQRVTARGRTCADCLADQQRRHQLGLTVGLRRPVAVEHHRWGPLCLPHAYRRGYGGGH